MQQTPEQIESGLQDLSKFLQIAQKRLWEIRTNSKPPRSQNAYHLIMKNGDEMVVIGETLLQARVKERILESEVADYEDWSDYSGEAIEFIGKYGMKKEYDYEYKH